MFHTLTTVYSFTLHLCCFLTVFGLNHEDFPWKCRQFVDERAGGERSEEILVPFLYNDETKTPLRFRMKESYNGSVASLFELHCKYPEYIRISTSSYASSRIFSNNTGKYPIQDQFKFEQDVYFTNDGYVHYKLHFINPKDYCILSLSDEEIHLKTCHVDCSADLSMTHLYKSHVRNNHVVVSRVCIPKCCGIDETLNITDSTCRRLNNTEPNYFFPFMHLNTPPLVPEINKQNVLVIPMLSRRPLWNKTTDLITPDASIWDNLHFYRKNLNCSKYALRTVLFNDVKDVSSSETIESYNFRVEVHSQEVQLKFLTRSRKWEQYKHDFCIDGADKWMTDKDKTRSVSQIILLCVPPDSSTHAEDYSKTMSGDIRIIWGEEGKIIWPGDFLLVTMLLICTAILLIGTGFYFVLRKHLNVFGFVVLSHLGCLTCSYAATFLSSMISMSEYSRVGSNAIIIVNSEFEGRRIGWFCVGIGVVCHYLYISSFLWLSALNSEAWLHLVRWGRSYWIYAINGWIVPFIFVLGLCIADGLNNDPWSNPIVPDYGVESCHVSEWSAGYFVHTPTGIVLTCNLVFIAVKLYKLYVPACFDHSKGSAEISQPSVNEGIPLKLFAIVCMVEIFTWLITTTEWVRVNNGQEKNWGRSLLLIVAAIVQTLVVVHVYCMNQVMTTLAAERLPFMKGIVSLLNRWKLLWQGGGMLAEFILVEDDPTDTVVIENDEIPRI